VKVSVIIISYERPETVGWTLESAIRQTYPNLEIVVVDASKNEECKHIAQTQAAYRFCQVSPNDKFEKWIKWKGENPECLENIKSILIPNTGIAAACNLGVEMSTGDSLMFLHDDNWIEPTYVEKTVALMTEGVGIVSTDMHVFSNVADSVVKTGPATLDILKNQNVIHASSLLRRKAFDQTGGNKEDVYEDWELWLNVIKCGWKVRNVDEPLFHYRKAEKSAITQYKERHEERIANMKKQHPDVYGQS
jgi:glycosyltransferase involved in cell wall biosynthesis